MLTAEIAGDSFPVAADPYAEFLSGSKLLYSEIVERNGYLILPFAVYDFAFGDKNRFPCHIRRIFTGRGHEPAFIISYHVVNAGHFVFGVRYENKFKAVIEQDTHTAASGSGTLKNSLGTSLTNRTYIEIFAIRAKCLPTL